MSTTLSPKTSLATGPLNGGFVKRHIGPNAPSVQAMLKALNFTSLSAFIDQTVPASIRNTQTLDLKSGLSEHDALIELKHIAEKNQCFKSYIGLGYYNTLTPLVIKRNVLENPGWYTAYTPYQPEIAQGRLEGLLNFQQMICDLTGMEMANASLLDEATAVAEAVAMAKRVARKNKSNRFYVDENCFPQTLAVLKTRAEHFGFDMLVGPLQDAKEHEYFAVVAQYPNANGELNALSTLCTDAQNKSALSIIATDLMALNVLTPPGEFGADIVVGSNQRFGIPMGFGGPHAAFFAFKEKYKRSTPGRIIGVSQDSRGKPALRMAMQTREQHIRREKANSNICTSQVLLAVMSAFYAMYHGAEGLKNIANRIHLLTKMLAQGITTSGYTLRYAHFFDTVVIETPDQQQALIERANKHGMNFRKVHNNAVGISLDETTSQNDVYTILSIFSGNNFSVDSEALASQAEQNAAIPEALNRKTPGVNHPVFEQYHSETEMLRYLKRLESKDIALNHAMIPLGSCTMKLNATAEMIPVTWPEFSDIHPFAPESQTEGYTELFKQLNHMLEAVTGYDAISLQPNAGSQGEYAGLLTIKKYFHAKKEYSRDICLIPASAHGTNPASAQMAGMQVIVIRCDNQGNVDEKDLDEKIATFGERIAALMITYPSTHGVFETHVQSLCEQVHKVGAQVYIDGANMNALVGVASPGLFGGDVSHLNLHKTFCIPHGGGGPGMGPIGVKKHLAEYLPNHPLTETASRSCRVKDITENSNTLTISAAPWGSASILPISWMYLRMMGDQGAEYATKIAILNANYIAHRLKNDYPILYTGEQGLVAHECLLDLKTIKAESGISEEDIAKRLMDYGFHAPTMSFPVAGTLMIEPTESESLEELDRFCDAMIQIRQEAEKVKNGYWPENDNPLANAPHTLDDIMDENWAHPYTREEAARPLAYLKAHKIWPSVNRIDNVFGDRNLICSCSSIDSYISEA